MVEAEQCALKDKLISIRDDNLFSTENYTVTPRYRGNIFGSLARFDRIPDDELQAGIVKVVKYSYGISAEDITAAVLKAFGYDVIPFGADAVIYSHIKKLFDAKVISGHRGQFYIAE